MPRVEIHVKGTIDPGMSEWFQGVSVKPISSEESCLHCDAVDNSAIYGILSTLSSLGITLISVLVKDNEGVHNFPTSDQGDLQ